MRNLMLIGLLGVGLMAAPAARAQPVQWSVGIGVGPGYAGPAPVCTYGYYDYYPYACAPYGYYGPDWFSGGVFIGAGPWYHGFRGNRDWDRRGFDGRGFQGDHFRGGHDFRGGQAYGHGAIGNGFRGGNARGGGGFRGGVHGGVRGGNGFHGGGSFHGGGGSHAGGRR